MSEFKHTPGPWDFRAGTTSGHWNIGLHNEFPECIGLRGDDYMCLHGICKEEDARLIAAAPDLLEALIMAEKMLCKQENAMRSLGAYDPCPESAILTSRAAIAKATGVKE